MLGGFDQICRHVRVKDVRVKDNHTVADRLLGGGGRGLCSLTTLTRCTRQSERDETGLAVGRNQSGRDKKNTLQRQINTTPLCREKGHSTFEMKKKRKVLDTVHSS